MSPIGIGVRRIEVACLDENLLVAFFSPGRSPAIAAEVEAHTADCQACRNLLVQYAEMSAESGTSQTRRGAERRSSPAAAVPSLTPGADARGEKVELPYPLAQAGASKLIGTVLKGRWHVERLLGFGGMAYVFAARHRNGRRAAIKCMRPELAAEPSLVERFLREGYVANTIEHRGAVAILDDDVMDDGTPFLVMELLEGKTLRQRLAGGPLGLSDSLRAISDVLDVLAVAHDKGIVHRDLKPENLFQTEDGSIKILDCGIARLRERARSEYETQTGTTMGTVGLMPPEQARGLTAAVDARWDVWAVGATLFTLLTGRAVHEAQTTNEALLLAMTTPVAPMATLLSWLPGSVQSLLDRALAFEKADRWASACAMKSALDAARAGLGSTVVLSAPPLPSPGAPLTEVAPAPASPSIISRAFARRGSSPRTGFAAPGGVAYWAIRASAAAFVLLLTGGIAFVLSRGDAPPAHDGAKLVATSPIAAEKPSAAPAESPASIPTSSPAPMASASTAPAAAIGAASPSVPSPSPRPPVVRLPAGAPALASALPPPLQTPAPTAAVTRDPLGVRR